VDTSSRDNYLWIIPSVWLFVRYLRLLQMRRRDPGDDLARRSFRRETGDTLSEDELVAMVFLLVAGHETTVNRSATARWRCCSIPTRWTDCAATRR
jgi:cytochrome P450